MRWHRLQILLDMVAEMQDEFGSVCFSHCVRADIQVHQVDIHVLYIRRNDVCVDSDISWWMQMERC